MVHTKPQFHAPANIPVSPPLVLTYLAPRALATLLTATLRAALILAATRPTGRASAAPRAQAERWDCRGERAQSAVSQT